MEPTTSEKPLRPWERVQPRPMKDRRSRETFRPSAPSPAEEVLALHDQTLDEEPEEERNEDPGEDESGNVLCF